MVLRLKTRESRSLPGLRNATTNLLITSTAHAETKGRPKAVLLAFKDHTAEQNNAAGWSSPVARQAHNLKAAGSNPAPATKNLSIESWLVWKSPGVADALAEASEITESSPGRHGINMPRTLDDFDSTVWVSWLPSQTDAVQFGAVSVGRYKLYISDYERMIERISRLGGRLAGIALFETPQRA
jgi:hypothetical protein